RQFMRRIRIVVPDDLAQKTGPMGENGVNWGEARITVNLHGGQQLKQACFHAKGWPGNPATWEDLAEKFSDCTDGILSPQQQRESIDILSNLERVTVRELLRALR